MTFKDKPKRPGTKPAGREHKPRGATSAGADKKSFADGKPSGEKKPFAGKPARDAKPAREGKPVRDARPAKAAPSVSASAELAPERISKLLARAGVASRRDIERMIMEGRIAVNGKVLDTPVVNATIADRIEVDGVPIRGIERTRLWLYHKPAGLVTTNADPEGRPTVFDNLPEDLPRVMSIGRLDINTEGLLLLTNDGGLARMLELPTTGWLRRYRVRAHGKIEQADLDKLKEGMAVDGVLYGAIDATLDKVQGTNVWLTLGLREGKNREVKNVLGALGLDVNRLIRISYGPFQLGELPEGHAQEIRGRTLRDQLGPRLIEEAKANFDAPLFDHAVEDADEKPAQKSRAEAPAWGERPAERHEKPADRREKARARLDTKRDDRFGDKPRGGAGAGGRDRDRTEDRFDSKPKREPAVRARKSNVWMAPGARPVAEKKAETADGVKREQRERPEGAPKTKRYGRTAEGGPARTAKKFDPDRKGPPRGRPGDDRADKPRVLKTRDDEGEWIRASEPEKSDDGGRGGFGRKRSGAGDDRPARSDRSFGDRKPQGERSFGDRKPRAEGARSFGDRKPRAEGERSFGDRKPRAEGERSFGDRKPRAEGERSFGDRKPRAEGERTVSDRPPRRDGGKPFGGKPSGGKSFGGGKPAGGRPSGGKPSGGRPAGGGSRPRGKGK